MKQENRFVKMCKMFFNSRNEDWKTCLPSSFSRRHYVCAKDKPVDESFEIKHTDVMKLAYRNFSKVDACRVRYTTSWKNCVIWRFMFRVDEALYKKDKRKAFRRPLFLVSWDSKSVSKILLSISRWLMPKSLDSLSKFDAITTEAADLFK